MKEQLCLYLFILPCVSEDLIRNANFLKVNYSENELFKYKFFKVE